MILPVLNEISFYINNGIQLLLVVYFGKRYLKTGVSSCWAWSLGFLTYASSGIFYEMVKKGFFTLTIPNFFIRATLIAIGIALFYYGISLLFFEKSHYKQEGVAMGFFAIMLLNNLYYAYSLKDVTEFIKTMNVNYTYLFIFPVFTLISVFFYKVYRRLPLGDLRKRNVLLLSMAWLGLAIFNLLYPMTHATDYHAITRMGTILSRIMLLYGMIYSEI